MVSQSVVVCLALLAAATATDVKQCEGKSFEDLSSNVQLTPCKKPPCKLKKGTDMNIKMDFVPEKDITKVVNNVKAMFLGVPVPFVGVDGNSVCDQIFTEDGNAASCPLKAGTKYSYKASFPVLPLYPTLTTIVTWSLRDEEENSIVCFEVGVKIVN